MPVVDIDLLRGRSVEELTAIADAVHDALVSEFGIPVEDRFQVIHQHEPHELIFDRNFLGGPRTDAFVLIRVVAGKARPPEVKQAFYTAVVENLTKRTGIDGENVFVVLDAVDVSDLSVAGGRPFRPPHLFPPDA